MGIYGTPGFKYLFVQSAWFSYRTMRQTNSWFYGPQPNITTAGGHPYKTL